MALNADGERDYTTALACTCADDGYEGEQRVRLAALESGCDLNV